MHPPCRGDKEALPFQSTQVRHLFACDLNECCRTSMGVCLSHPQPYNACTSSYLSLLSYPSQGVSQQRTYGVRWRVRDVNCTWTHSSTVNSADCKAGMSEGTTDFSIVSKRVFPLSHIGGDVAALWEHHSALVEHIPPPSSSSFLI